MLELDLTFQKLVHFNFFFQLYLKEYVLVAVAKAIAIQRKCPVPNVLCLKKMLKST